MDGKAFDHLARRLSRDTSRRRILGGVGALAVGLLTGRSAAAKARPVTNGC